MIQGGDDRRVVVWNVEKCVYRNGSPVIMKGEHRSNIFCTVFDIENRHIFSAGRNLVVLHSVGFLCLLHKKLPYTVCV